MVCDVQKRRSCFSDAGSCKHNQLDELQAYYCGHSASNGKKQNEWADDRDGSFSENQQCGGKGLR